MKKNLAKRIVLGLLTGAVLMSSSVAWAEDYTVYHTGGYGSFGVGYSNSDDSDVNLNPGGVVSTATNSIVIGSNSVISGSSSIGLGLAVEVTTDHSVAIGSNASVTGVNGVALGAGAKVEGVLGVALGKGSIASGYVVSVGDGGAVDSNNKSYGPDYRKIVNVEDGEIDTGSHEAVTGGQLYDNYGGGAATLKTNGSTLIEGKGYDLTTALIKLSEEVEDNIYTKEQVNNLLSNGGAGGNGGNYVEKETIEGGTQTNISENFVVTNTGSDNNQAGTTTVTINASDSNNPIVMDNEGITVGTNSTRMDGKGFYVWADGQNNNTTSDHDPDKAIASINDKGEIKGVNGTFSGNVTATKLYIDKGNGSTIDVENELGKKANSADVYKKTETYSQTEVDSKVNALQQVDLDLQTQINNIGGDNTAAIAGINQRLDKTNAKINKVGAGAAALAALHPLDYDPDDKLTFSAGMGNYAGENAAALGAFYRPNEKFMLSLGGTMGNGENMVNLGLSIGLDKANGFAKMSKRELIQEVNAVKAENEAMKDQLANADERIAKLEALVAQLVAK